MANLLLESFLHRLPHSTFLSLILLYVDEMCSTRGYHSGAFPGRLGHGHRSWGITEDLKGRKLGENLRSLEHGFPTSRVATDAGTAEIKFSKLSTGTDADVTVEVAAVR